MAKGTSLFGWCLPTMGKDQHELCRVSYTYYDTERVCPCPCHTDPSWLDKQFAKPVKKRKQK